MEQNNNNRKIIKLILVRHGIALHNVLHRQSQQTSTLLHGTAMDNDDDDILFDPPLTMEGKIQSLMIGETIRTYVRQQHNLIGSSSDSPPMQYKILTSPLTRCLQTSMYAFGIPEEYHLSSSQITQTILCHDDLREACGLYNCDRRRMKSQLQQYWNNNSCIRFHNDMSEFDTLWSKTNRETMHDLQQRIERFMIWFLPSYDNDDIVILITHGVWIETMIQMYNPLWSATSTTKRIYNADMHYCECIYTLPSFGTTNAQSSQFNIALQNIQQIHPSHR
jgi:broad specificity phosphatase PhoE